MASSSTSTPANQTASESRELINNNSSLNLDMERDQFLQQQQLQQQELIKILAQHFQHQFYQLHNTPNGNSNQHQHFQHHQNHQRLASELAILNQVVGSANFDFNLSLNNPTAASTLTNSTTASLFSAANNQLLHNRPTAQSTRPTGDTGRHIQTSTTNESLGRTNGLTSNQLVLSAIQQQQSNFVAHTPVPSISYDSMAQNAPAHQAASLRQSSTMIKSELNGNIKATPAIASQRIQKSREMLKFSINTILGRSSSPSGTDNSELQSNGLNNILRDRINSKKSNRKLEPIKLSGSNCDQSTDNLTNLRDGDETESNDDDDDDDDDGVEEDEMEEDEMNNGLETESDESNRTNNVSVFNQAAASNRLGPTSKTTTLDQQSAYNQHRQQQSISSLRHHQHSLGASQHRLPQFLSTPAAAFPWTVATRGKPRRGMMRRAVFSDGQRVGLEKRFQLQKYISKPDRKKLAEKLGLRDSQVKIWFQNRRMKWRNSKERELLSAGGSREQTLPTRNNPNPDLSDVGETVKRLQQATSPSVTNTTLQPIVNQSGVSEK